MRNRLQSILQPNGQKTSLLYDFRGNLIQQQDSGPISNLTQHFVLDALTNVAQVARSDGEQQSILSGSMVDQDLALIHSNGQVAYSLKDATNSTVATADQTGTLTATFAYEPFGYSASSALNYPFQFTGRAPVSSDLYYYRSRYYDPSIARFISEDSSHRDVNLYVYGSNNPLTFADPDGRQPVDISQTTARGTPFAGPPSTCFDWPTFIQCEAPQPGDLVIPPTSTSPLDVIPFVLGQFACVVNSFKVRSESPVPNLQYRDMSDYLKYRTLPPVLKKDVRLDRGKLY